MTAVVKTKKDYGFKVIAVKERTHRMISELARRYRLRKYDLVAILVSEHMEALKEASENYESDMEIDEVDKEIFKRFDLLETKENDHDN
jgi:nucleoside-triphosphatase THEP1